MIILSHISCAVEAGASKDYISRFRLWSRNFETLTPDGFLRDHIASLSLPGNLMPKFFEPLVSNMVRLPTPGQWISGALPTISFPNLDGITSLVLQFMARWCPHLPNSQLLSTLTALSRRGPFLPRRWLFNLSSTIYFHLPYQIWTRQNGDSRCWPSWLTTLTLVWRWPVCCLHGYR